MSEVEFVEPTSDSFWEVSYYFYSNVYFANIW